MAYRRDRDITREVPAYRRMLAHVTPDRDAASVSFRQSLDLSKTLPWLEAESERLGHKVSLLHLYLAAAGRVLNERPRLNRYCTGTRFFQRDGVWASVSAKKSLEDGAKVVMLKVPLLATDDPNQVRERLAVELDAGRRGETLDQEKEHALFMRLPDFLIGWLVGLATWLDRRHWLPSILADPDPLFSSLVVANLGSVGLDAAYHHLYEWGNCPLFVVIGRIDGTRVDLEYTFDERVEDGLYCALSLKKLVGWVEDPETLRSPD